MAKEQEQGQNSVNSFGGLNTDSSLVTQPVGTTRFVLTGVDETKEGDTGFISNEESNEECYTLPVSGSFSFVPVGKVYIGDENHLIFLAHPYGISSIALLDKECNLTVIVTDEAQTEKFNFKVTHQIDATFRLRRGCERTVYWVDPKPRVFCIDREDKFKVTGSNEWDIDKFSLFRKYQDIPQFADVSIVEGGGILAPGSYNFSIRYLDQDFNPTQFVNSCETVSIYNSPTTASYGEIRGSTKEVVAYQEFRDTNKAIKLTLSNLDTTYPFYSIAIIEANTGSGQISSTKITAPIGTDNNIFTYTGTNFQGEISLAEVTTFIDDIESADTIEQLENRLILGNTKSKQINYCALQKYASKITTDLVVREVIVTSLDDSSAKDPVLNNHGVGYMPGEIYSAGIVYIFDDYSESPAFHIPGKSNSVPNNTVFSPGTNVYPMSNENNTCADTTYQDNSTCASEDYWGRDSVGFPLKDTNVRHHRFPLRTDINVPMITEVSASAATNYFKILKIEVTGDLLVPRECTASQIAASTCTPTEVEPFVIKVNYTEDGVTNILSEVIDPADWSVGQGESTTVTITKVLTSDTIISDVVLFSSITEGDVTTPLAMVYNSSTGVYSNTTDSPKGLTYSISVVPSTSINSGKVYKSKMFGLKFSNIDMPAPDELGGKNVIGYYIVRHERTEQEKTILDSAVVFPTVKYSTFVSHGLLKPEVTDPTIFKRDIVSFVNPEFKFNNRDYSNITSVIHQGTYTPSDVIKSRVKINDVQDGSGYNAGKHKGGENDKDGFTIQIKTRDIFYKYYSLKNFTVDFSSINEIFYLNALEDKPITSSTGLEDVFNLACDNKVGIMKLNANFPTFGNGIATPSFVTGTNIPYVYFFRNNLNPYSNFRIDSMYKESNNPVYFGGTPIGNTTQVFNGDSYVSAIKYTNSVFFDNRMRQRAGKTSAWNYIIAAVLVVVAVVAAIFIPGAGVAAGAALAGLAASLVGGAVALTMSGIKQDSWNRAYKDLYNKGLRKTITDSYLLDDRDPSNNAPRGFHKNPTDDEIQWLGEAANLWFESSVNMGLRNGATDNTPDFVNAPAKIEPGTTAPEWNWEYFGIYSVGNGGDILPTNSLDTHMLNKLTRLDTERKSGRAYNGLALAEIYNINKDYTRRNKQKVFYPLGLDYDCCSDCVETFPHRWSWSEQSFQEELTDNFRTFLPNNYKDLEAETGPITDMYRIQNSLFIHTTEGLWHCPQTFQERVTSDVISFIGTGEYFSIPPRKIVDDNNSSAGNRHKWARTKTKFGVLFPSHKEKKWYMFDGQQLKPISDNGNYSWFKNNMKFLSEENYYNSTSLKYPYSNNPSNFIGVGYLSTYDTLKERLIVTKKDVVLTGLPASDYEICTEGGSVVYFPNMSTTLADRLDNGWTYLGMEDCELKFAKTGIESVEKTRIVSVWVPPVTTTVPFEGDCRKVSKITFIIDFEPIEPSEDPTMLPNGSASVSLVDCSGKTHTAFASTVQGTLHYFTLYLDTCIPYVESMFVPGTYVPDMTVTIDPGIIISQTVILGTGECGTTTTTPGYWDTTTETYYVDTPGTEYEYETGLVLDTEEHPIINNSWTMSYSLKREEWRSWHPYLPSFYFHVQEKFYSWPQNSTRLWRHNAVGSYQTFYGTRYPFIVEYVDNPSPLTTKIWNNIMFQTEAKKFDPTTQEYNDQRNVTFNKALMYNTEQISGELTLLPKQNTSIDYLYQQTKNLTGNQITIDRNERDWTLNDMRDLRADYDVPMFIKSVGQLQTNYYIDKIVNTASISYTKDWTQLTSFRDKYLVVRLIFDNFADTRLTFNFSALDKIQSER